MKHAISITRPSADALRLLGAQIHEARIALGLTVKDTAGRLGIDHRTLRAVDLFGLDPEELAAARRRAFVWAWLPGRTDPASQHHRLLMV